MEYPISKKMSKREQTKGTGKHVKDYFTGTHIRNINTKIDEQLNSVVINIIPKPISNKKLKK